MAASMEKAEATSSGDDNWENINSMQDIKDALAAVSQSEESINDQLDSLLQEQEVLELKLSSLHKMMPNLSVIHNDAKQLTGMISFTSQLAENVSGKVRQLDLAKNNVLAASLRVEDVLDLKYCTDGVQSAMQEESYEQAAALIHRFLSMDETILKMSADAAEGSSLNTSFTLLHDAEGKLKTITHNKFDAAVHSSDAASVERFFKLFPLLGIHKEGLTKFAKYLSAQISETASEKIRSAEASKSHSPIMYSDLLESLFESIAKMVEIHQPLVETKYGHGWLLVFAEWLQKECDRQVRKILEHFRAKREFSMVVKKVQEGLSPKSTALEKYDPKSLDVLLGEMTMMNAKSELYLRFLRRRLSADVESLDITDEQSKEKLEKIDDLVHRSDLSRQMQELIGSYIMMEEYYMREMAQKAADLDDMDPSSTTSSVVDDTFYLLKKSIRRAMTSSSIDGVCAVMNHACSTLEEDFVELLRSRLKLGYPSGNTLSQAYTLVQSSLQQGKLQSNDIEKARQLFLVSLNNAEVSDENIQTLKKSVESELPKLLSSDKRHTQEKLESCLSDLGHLSKRFKDVLDFGFDQLRSSAIKSKVKPFMEAFLSTSHNINEDVYAQYEAEDPWVQSFIVDLDAFMQLFKTSLTPSNHEKFISFITSEITSQMEKAVFKIAFNRLGGLQFDRELRSMLGYLTNVTTWTIRDKFARLTQMSTVLNLDRVEEILDYWGANSGPFTWRLAPSEVRQILALRVDFSNEEIRKLKL